MTRFLTSLTLFGVLPFAGVSASGDSTSTSDLVHRLAERVEQGAYAPSELREVAERGGLAVRVAAARYSAAATDSSDLEREIWEDKCIIERNICNAVR